jgi:hypothetical protein
MKTIRASRWVLSLFIFLCANYVFANVTPAGREFIAYENAVNAFVSYKGSNQLDDSELRWSQGLKELALSKSKKADLLLARIALLNADGVFSEELSCAISKRGKGLSLQLNNQLKNFDSRNICVEISKKEGINRNLLCASKEQFTRTALLFQKLPLSDNEGACSY